MSCLTEKVSTRASLPIRNAIKVSLKSQEGRRSPRTPPPAPHTRNTCKRIKSFSFLFLSENATALLLKNFHGQEKPQPSQSLEKEDYKKKFSGNSQVRRLCTSSPVSPERRRSLRNVTNYQGGFSEPKKPHQNSENLK